MQLWALPFSSFFNYRPFSHFVSALSYASHIIVTFDKILARPWSPIHNFYNLVFNIPCQGEYNLQSWYHLTANKPSRLRCHSSNFRIKILILWNKSGFIHCHFIYILRLYSLMYFKSLNNLETVEQSQRTGECGMGCFSQGQLIPAFLSREHEEGSILFQPLWLTVKRYTAAN